MSDTQNEPLPGEKAIKVKKAGPILSGADRYDIFEKGQKAIHQQKHKRSARRREAKHASKTRASARGDEGGWFS